MSDSKVICEIGDRNEPPNSFRQLLIVRVSGRIATIHNYIERNNHSQNIYLTAADARKLGESLIAFADEDNARKLTEIVKPQRAKKASKKNG